jgi:predicted branched-subunit amino acid permease
MTVLHHERRPPWAEERRGIVANALGVGIAVAAYGVPSAPSGLTALQTQILRAHNTGGSQFAFIGVLAAGGGAVSAVATSVLLGVRNAFYGLSMAEVLHVRGLRRVVAAQLTIDESTAMAVSRSAEHDGGRASRFAFWATGLSVFVFWNLATLAGAIGANALGDPKRLGLDAAIPPASSPWSGRA